MHTTRNRLPDRRHNWTQKARIDGQLFYLTVGEYDDGRPGEIFLTTSKLGTFARGVIDSLARSVSHMLQSGYPLAEVVDVLRGLSFPPNGAVEGSAVESCTSVSDWIAQELAGTYPQFMAPPEKVWGAFERGPGY